MSANLRYTSLLFASLAITACDPSSIDQSAAASSNSNVAYEILSSNNTNGSIVTASVTSDQGTGNGVYDDPVVLNPDKPFQIDWKMTLNEASLLNIGLYSAENPDAGNGKFFSFSECNPDGKCPDYSVTCTYNLDPDTGRLDHINCPFTHPVTGVEIPNSSSFARLEMVDQSADSAVYELRIELCTLADLANCDNSRIAYIEINR